MTTEIAPTPQTSASTLIPLTDFFDSPTRIGAVISPDGSRYAFLAPWHNRLNVWIQDLDSDAEPHCVTADDNRSVSRFRWTDDPRWLLYQQDSNGDENWHVYRVDLDDPAAPAVDLTPFPGARTMSLEKSQVTPGAMTLLLNARNAAEFDLYELDVASGELTVLAETTEPGGSWVQGRDGDLLWNGITADGDWQLSRRDAETGDLALLTSVPGIDHPMGVTPMQITPDGTGMWMESLRGTDLPRLVRLDLTTGEETEVDSHPTLSLDSTRRAVTETSSPLILDRATGDLLGVRYLGERQVIHALDPRFADILANLEKLSDGDVGELSSDTSGEKWIVSFVHDRDPGATWLYDHATGASRLLFRPFPHLDPSALSPMRPVTIPARDGLDLPSYLTLPSDIPAPEDIQSTVDLDERLPLVVLVHGGPWYRDAWNYSPIVQLLANRGYAVLQVNFRGSIGYGKAHMQAAIGEFAGKMHDDLIDSVDWAVDHGYVDRERVAIFGGSYGGYAALVGAAFTPDVFAAAIDYVGISNLANLIRTQPVFVRPAFVNTWFRYIGDPDDPKGAAEVDARSPINRVDDIRNPLLVAQGANDVRVVREESDLIVEALREREVEVEYLVFDDEGHGFVNPENSIAFYRASERFLARHLGGRQEDGPQS
ncbi:S9 family peptidase [Gordonia soli]|uniref:Peptidase S9 family protein n=1 Tax=Gordonia soli NBRC 108243 TaxID=1223545 RepID=M0QJJ8_9ACTN|nr:S9 family peptidase [Gordonia soli]GAC68441.1 peptidase S9 family protein [Gordonia soli NBRC 108243]